MNEQEIQEGTRKRHWLMSFWRDEMARTMALPEYADFEDPVGLIIAIDDVYGRPIAEAIGSKNGVSVERLDALCEECKRTGDYPTLRLISTSQEVRKILPYTSETAGANFDKLNSLRKPGDQFLIVIGYGGNSYGFVKMPTRAPHVARDGQNRTRR